MLTHELHLLGQRLQKECIRLRPGLTRSELSAARADLLPLDLPEQLCALYEWHNGHAEEPVTDFAPFGFEWMSISTAMQTRLELEPHLPPNFQKFLPIGGFDGGPVLASLSGFHRDVCQLFYYFSEEDELCLVHSSILSFVRTVSECYDQTGKSSESLLLKHSPCAWTFEQDGILGANGVRNVFSLNDCMFDGLIEVGSD